MAQGSKLTPDQIQAVADALGISPSWRAAADYAGINERTIHRYRERHDAYTKRHETDDDLPNLPDETDPDYLTWSAVQQWIDARSQLEMTLVAGVLGAIPKDWKAAHAMLKSGWPQDYSDRVELTGAGGGPLQIEALKTEALERAEQQLEEMRERTAELDRAVFAKYDGLNATERQALDDAEKAERGAQTDRMIEKLQEKGEEIRERAAEEREAE